MSDVIPKHELTDVGTRYQHYSDLLEGWRAAEDILSRMNPAFMTPADKMKLQEVKTAIELLEKQLRSLAQFNLKVSRLGDLIDTTLDRKKMSQDPNWVSYEQAAENDKERTKAS